MAELVAYVEEETKEVKVEKMKAQEPYRFSNGYELRVVDLGFYDGAKLILEHKQYDTAAIILPPAEVERFCDWLARTMGQVVPHLPNRLPDILNRMLGTRGDTVTLRRGDKRAIKETAEIIRIFEKGKVE